MSKNSENTLQVVFIVTCYQSIINVYASQDDACTEQRNLIAKGRPADVLCRSVVYPFNPNS